MPSSIQSSVGSNSTPTTTDSSDEYFQTYLRPFAVVIRNLLRPKSNGYRPLGDHLNKKLDFNIKGVLTAYKEGQSEGYAVLVFGRARAHYVQAVKLHSAFDDAYRGAMDWEKDDHESQPYGWLADKNDISMMGRYKKHFVPFTTPENWIEEAFDTKSPTTKDMYRVVRLFAPRLKYRDFP